MTRKEFDKWIKALRSGKYKQGKSALRSIDNKFCCLGVYLDAVKKVKWERDDAIVRYSCQNHGLHLPRQVAIGSFYNELGRSKSFSQALTSLTTLNDTGHTFEQIADILEKNPEDYVIIQEES